MKKIKKFFSTYFLFFFSILLIFLSLNVGITHDESHHDLVWLVNKNIYSNYFLGTNYDIVFPGPGSNYYGIGFQILSLPFEFIIQFINTNIFQLDKIGNLTLKHPSIVIFFIISVIYFKKILYFFLNDELYSQIGASLFLLYPYILGHSFFNTLDIPFLSVWIVCTYFLIKIFNGFSYNNKFILKDVIILSLLTAYLLSIRISGLLIFLQYLIFLSFGLINTKVSLNNFLKENYKFFIIFFLICFSFFLILHPNYWNDPKKIIESVLYMSNHIQTVCTTTLGDCMKAQDLPPSYIPIWLFFKLPIIILIGLALFPLVEKKLFNNKTFLFNLIPLIVSVVSIILILIFLKVNLYDELRQVLFLIPLIFIISLTFLYLFSKKIGYFLIFIYLIFFIFQNIKIYPYNYVWLNNVTKFTSINGVFELDYWGVSTKKISDYFNSNRFLNDGCIISNRSDALKELINKK